MWGKNFSLFQDTWRSKIFSIVDIFEEDLVVLQNTDKVNVNLPGIPIHSLKVRFLLKISLKQYMYKLFQSKMYFLPILLTLKIFN